MNLDKKQKILIIIIGIIAICVISFYIYTNIQNVNNDTIENSLEDNIQTSSNTIITENTEDNTIVVHIAGQVNNPGIVKLHANARVVDAIEAAGGLLDSADLTNINLAYTLEDGQKVYIPSIDEIKSTSENDIEYITSFNGNNIISDKTNSKGDDNIMININKATQTQLEHLPGIGPSTALSIIEYRNENGKFNSIEDIKNVTGIGSAKFNNIKDYICV